jgi:hypothetical protein
VGGRRRLEETALPDPQAGWRVLCAAISQLCDSDEGPGEHDGFVIITADNAGGMVNLWC